MKAIILLALFVVAATAQLACVTLEQTDEACEGHRSKFPAKVCGVAGSNATSAFFCDGATYFNIWAGLCPLKNKDNATYCEGAGYATGYTNYPTPCFALVACTKDEDCNPTPQPVAPQAPPPLLCYECCTFCFSESECQTKVKANDTFTESSTCTPCREEPVAAPSGGGGNPTTPGVKAPNAAAAVVVSGTILAFAAALLF